MTSFLKGSSVVIWSLFLSASCEDKKKTSASAPVESTGNKDDEEKKLKEKQAKDNDKLIRDLSINKIKTDLVGDDNTVKNIELIAAVLVDANHFFKKNFAKFEPIGKKELEDLKDNGLVLTYSGDSFRKFFIESLQERGLEEDLIDKIVNEIIELLRIQYIKDKVKRKEKIVKYANSIEKQKSDNVGGMIEILLKEFQRALENPPHSH